MRNKLLAALMALMVVPLAAAAGDPTIGFPNGDGPDEWGALQATEWNGGVIQNQGAGDGFVSFFRQDYSTWQAGELIVFQPSANGHTYRHHGPDFDTLSPGQWVWGPDQPGMRYSGISSIVRASDGQLYAFTHDEWGVPNAPEATATIGVLKANTLDGYGWTRIASDIVPLVNSQNAGFLGTMTPSVHEAAPGHWVMYYSNRPGSGTFNEHAIYRAVANNPAGPWTSHGAAITETAAPDYYAEGSHIVWSIPHQKWLMTYSTDTSVKYVTSHNLFDWSAPTVLVDKPDQWSQTGGAWRWYPGLIDDTQADSGVIGSNPHLTEHFLFLPGFAVRYPSLIDVEIG